MPKPVSFLDVLALAAGPANAHEIIRYEGLDPAESVKAVEQVQALFDSIEAIGMERTMLARFPGALIDSATSQETLNLYRELDANCGPITQAELIREQAFGSLVLEQTYVTRMGTCLVKWDIVLEREGDQWLFNWLNFNTLTGNRWEM